MRILDIGKTKLYELIAAGELETIHIGRRTLVLRDSIDARRAASAAGLLRQAPAGTTLLASAAGRPRFADRGPRPVSR